MTREERLQVALLTARGRFQRLKRYAETQLGQGPPTRTDRMRLERIVDECRGGIRAIDDVLESRQISFENLG